MYGPLQMAIEYDVYACMQASMHGGRYVWLNARHVLHVHIDRTIDIDANIHRDVDVDTDMDKDIDIDTHVGIRYVERYTDR